jgi:hypothetical protein
MAWKNISGEEMKMLSTVNSIHKIEINEKVRGPDYGGT